MLLGERVHDRLSLRKINSETQNQECACVCVQLVVCVYNERKLFILRVLEGTIVVKVGVNFLFWNFMLTKHFDASSLTPVMFQQWFPGCFNPIKFTVSRPLGQKVKAFKGIEITSNLNWMFKLRAVCHLAEYQKPRSRTKKNYGPPQFWFVLEQFGNIFWYHQMLWVEASPFSCRSWCAPLPMGSRWPVESRMRICAPCLRPRLGVWTVS